MKDLKGGVSEILSQVNNFLSLWEFLFYLEHFCLNKMCAHQ